MYFWNPTAFQLECSKMPTASELPASGRSANLSAWLHEGRRVLPFVIAACRGVCGICALLESWRFWEWVIQNLKHCREIHVTMVPFSHSTFTEGPIQTRSNWNPETWKTLKPWLGINRIAQEVPVFGIIFQFFCELVRSVLFWLPALSRVRKTSTESSKTLWLAAILAPPASSVPFHNRSIGRESVRAECLIFVYCYQCSLISIAINCYLFNSFSVICQELSLVTPPKTNTSPEKLMVGLWISFWNGPLFGDMLIFGGVSLVLTNWKG